MIHKAKDLSPEQKLAISVRAIAPPVLSDQQKHELAEHLRKYFAEVDARRQPGSAEEAEDIDGGHPKQPRRLPFTSVKIVLDKISSKNPSLNT